MLRHTSPEYRSGLTCAAAPPTRQRRLAASARPSTADRRMKRTFMTTPPREQWTPRSSRASILRLASPRAVFRARLTGKVHPGPALIMPLSTFPPRGGSVRPPDCCAGAAPSLGLVPGPAELHVPSRVGHEAWRFIPVVVPHPVRKIAVRTDFVASL